MAKAPTFFPPFFIQDRGNWLCFSNKPAARTVGCLPPLLFLSLFCEPGRIIVLFLKWPLLLPTTTTTTTTSESGEGQKTRR
jgi:hypothetical protein